MTHIVWMSGSLFNHIIAQYLALRYKQLERAGQHVHHNQEKLLKLLLSEAAETEYGKQFGFSSIRSRRQFQEQIPLVRYQDLVSRINDMMLGKSDVLWPGQLKYFAKSSGTTHQRSKFIPISNAYLRSNLIRSSWDTTAFIYHQEPGAEIFKHKSLIMGGSLHPFANNRDILVGDVSAIMIKTIPFIGRPFYTPDFNVALLSDWEEKIAKICKQCIDENVVMFGGVPTWNIVLFNKILQITGKSNILEVWPNLNFYLHGGVNFEPYKETFKSLYPKRISTT
ncbi:MAG: GH3 auxin-responsive promoter family protein [Saprospiraceae bacterium]|nr:GH3 auxin-responsive promoter family protein [Saprospiraceae bacterium]